jgi:hypothetical protein
MDRLESHNDSSPGSPGLIPAAPERFTRAKPMSDADKIREVVHISIESPESWKLQDRDLTIRGWCFGKQEISVRAVRGRRGKHVWRGEYGGPRPETAHLYPAEAGAANSGFEVEVKVPTLPGRLTLEVEDQFGRWHEVYGRWISRWRSIYRRGWLRALGIGHPKAAAVLPKVISALRWSDCVLAISHDDYRRGVAGTQKVLQQEQALLAARKISYIQIHPASLQPAIQFFHGDFLMGLYVDSQYLGALAWRQVRKILLALADRGVTFRATHLHHLLGFRLGLVEEILHSVNAPKRFFLHDFHSVCQQFNLMKNGTEFCGGPPLGSPTCRDCAHGPGRPAHFLGYRALLNRWNPEVVAPSTVARDLWGGAYSALAKNVRIVPHQVGTPASTNCKPPELNQPRLRVAYVGYQLPIKGWAEWKLVAKALPREKYELFVIGQCFESLPDVHYIPVSFISDGSDAMLRALRELHIHLAFLWSLVPETYSFTLFESLAAGCFVLTNPRSGNIAAQVERERAGLVAKDLPQLLEFLTDANQVRAQLAAFQTRYPPFELAPNPQVPDEIAASVMNLARRRERPAEESATTLDREICRMLQESK